MPREAKSVPGRASSDYKRPKGRLVIGVRQEQKEGCPGSLHHVELEGQ